VSFITRNYGDWASVAGLVFSILAFVFSKRASKAAKEARDLALKRSLSQDLSAADRVAREIVTFMLIERSDMARIRTVELINDTSYLVTRWRNHLSEQSRVNLQIARERLQSIQAVLSKSGPQELTPDRKSRVLKLSQEASQILSEELGAAIRASDEV
jgi:hypothetical protein